MPLTEKEKNELKILENPDVQYMTPATNALAHYFIHDVNKRKKRVVELRVKQKMEELNLDSRKDWQEYYKIEEEVVEEVNENFNRIYFKR